MYGLDLEKAEESEINYQHLLDQRESKGIPEKSYFCFTDYAKAFDCVYHNKLWKILKEKGIPDHLTCFLRNLYAGQEATVRTRHRTSDWFKLGKEYKAVYCHSAYLTSVWCTSCEMPGWMKHKLELGLLGEISVNSHMSMTPSLYQKTKRNWRASSWM